MAQIKGKLDNQSIKARRKDKKTIELTVSDTNGTAIVLLSPNSVQLVIKELDSLFEELEL